MKTTLALLMLTFSALLFASDKVVKPEITDSKFCYMDEKKNSLGAVVEKDGKNYQCVRSFDSKMSPSYSWIEVTLVSGTQPVIK